MQRAHAAWAYRHLLRSSSRAAAGAQGGSTSALAAEPRTLLHHREQQQQARPSHGGMRAFHGTGVPFAEGPPGAVRSVDAAETAKFSAVADEWWDHKGPFKPLHAMNPVRVSFIEQALRVHRGLTEERPLPLEGLAMLDVGCGGGLLSEALARLGATVTGVDAAPDNIAVAREHAFRDPTISDRITYRAVTAEQLVEEGARFDAVASLEVIEHVRDPEDFARSLVLLTKPGGALFLATMSRSARALATAVVAAEYVLGMVPRGTHDWSKFLTPEEMVLMVHRAGGEVREIAGMAYNPLTNRWSLVEDTEVNYIAYFSKGGGEGAGL